MLWLQGTLMDVLKWLPPDHPQRLSAVIFPLCLVASRKVEGADQNLPPGSSEPLPAIVPHDQVVTAALKRIKAALEAEACQQLAPAEGELVCASAVQAACVALNNYRTPHVWFLHTPDSSLPLSQVARSLSKGPAVYSLQQGGIQTANGIFKRGSTQNGRTEAVQECGFHPLLATLTALLPVSSTVAISRHFLV
jgi:hypothetical protein